MAGTVYTVQPMAPDPASTDWFEVEPLRIGVEYRRVDPAALEEAYGDDDAGMAEIEEHSPEGGFTDEGVSIHIVDPRDDHEYVRFDVFVDEPHYHYVDKVAGTNTVVEFDTIAHGPMTPWMLVQLRTRLPDMLRHAGADALAGRLDAESGAALADRVAAHLREIGAL